MIKEDDMNKVFKNPDAAMTAFLFLSCVPIGETVDTRYGNITRKTCNEFFISIKDKLVSKKLTEENTRQDKLNAVKNLFS